MQRSGVYIITNTVNNKQYVGSAKDIAARWLWHRAALADNRHHNSKLQRAHSKYGADVFVYEVLEKCPLDVLIEREQYWLDMLSTVQEGYNLYPTARSPRGTRWNDEQRARRSRKNLEDPNMQERLRRMREASQTPEARARHKEAMQRRYATAREAIDRESALRAARRADPEYCRRRAQHLIDSPVTEERRAKIGQRTKERWADPDYRARVSQKLKEAAARKRQGN